MNDQVMHVGLTVLLETSYKARLKTQVLGWKDQSFVILDMAGQPPKVADFEPCKVRFLKNDFAYGFESQIVTVLTHPVPLIVVQYPARLESVKVQVAERYRTDIAARLLDRAGVEIAAAMISDISEGGCGIRIPALGQREIPPDASYLLAFQLGGKDLQLECGIRTVEQKADACSLGMQFLNLTEESRKTVRTFLDQLRTGAPGQKQPG